MKEVKTFLQKNSFQLLSLGVLFVISYTTLKLEVSQVSAQSIDNADKIEIIEDSLDVVIDEVLIKLTKLEANQDNMIDDVKEIKEDIKGLKEL